MATITGTSLNDVITEDDLTGGITGGIPSAVSDLIDGLAGNDLVDGSGGDDTIYGGWGDDTLFGGEGNDVLDNDPSSSGNDSLVGGAGNDTLFAYQNDTIDGGEGDDLIRVRNDMAYVLRGGSGRDTVSLAYSSWVIGTTFSLDGNGIEVIQANGEEIYGGFDNNLFNFAGITLDRVQYLDLQAGNDTVYGFSVAMDVRGGSGSDSIVGSAGNDSLHGGSEDDTLVGGEGNDILDNESSSYGNDSLIGGSGNDTLFAYQNDTIDAGDGDDLIRVSDDQSYFIQGGIGRDTVSIASQYWLIGTGFNLVDNSIERIEGNGEEIYGGSVSNLINFNGITLHRVPFIDLQDGNDILNGLSMAMDVRGGFGNDSIEGSSSNDSLYGGWGDDTLVGGDGNDILDNDSNYVGNDSLVGGAGNDFLFAYQNDTIDAGDGDDFIRVWYDQAYSIQGGGGNDIISIASFYWIIGTAFSLAGNGVEKIDANGKEIYGGSGNNELNFSGITLDRVFFLDLQDGNDTVTGFSVSMDVRGGNGNDSIAGSAGNDSLYGGSNDDTLVGGEGHDILDSDSSSGGNDSLVGGAGNDTFFAYQNDTIDAGDGDDLMRVSYDQAYQLQGGSGNDTVSIAGQYWVIGTFFSLDANGIERIEGNGEEIYGGSGNNLLNFSGIALNRVQFLDLQDGNDSVSGLALATDVRGGNGNDSIMGSDGSDVLSGGSNDDTLLGGGGNDVLDVDTTNAAGNDSLVGGGGNDTLYAYGNDTIDAGSDDDLIRVWSDQAYILRGGTGTDTVSIAQSSWTIGPTFNLLVNGIEVIDGNGEEIYGGSANNMLDFTGITLNRVQFFDLQDGNDTLAGLSIATDVRGGSGNDSITGSGGNDSLSGGSGDDILLGGVGNDVLDSDTSSGFGNDSLVAGAGNDTLFAYGNDTIDGGADDDLIRVWTDQAYTLRGGAGTDTVSIANQYWFIGTTFNLLDNGIEVIQGNGEEIYGGANNNLLNFSGITLNRVQFLDLQDGNDTVSGLGVATDVRGGNGNDSITGSGGNDSLSGGSNDDILLGGSGNDILDSDTSSSAGNDYLEGGGGNDSIFAYGNDTVVAGDGDDFIRVMNDQAYSLNGGTGTDTVSIASWQWIINPTFSRVANGIEIIQGNNREILGGSSNNIIDFTSISLHQILFIDLQDGNDSVIGSSSADDLRGGTGDDTLVGGDGNDILRGHHGIDRFDGGDGSDTLDYSFTGTGGTIALPTGISTLGGVNESFTSIENVIGTNGQDSITGSNDDNRLEGNYGNDVLRGGLGNDTLSGGFGFDTLDGSDGLDTVDFTYLPTSSQVVIDLQLAIATLTGSETGAEPILSFENAIGGAGNDSLVGTSTVNRLEGFDGNDTILGYGGGDTLIGGLGMDVINGGDDIDIVDYRYTNRLLLGGTIDLSTGMANMGGGDQDTLLNVEWVIGSEGRDTILGSDLANHLDGQRSNDSIVAGLGHDTVLGGLGNDTLDGGGDNDSILGGNGNDLIFGGAGDDTLHGNAGSDMVYGGLGNDLYFFDGSPDTFIELVSEGTDRVEATASVTLSENIEHATLTGSGSIDATGNDLNNILTGNLLANRLFGLNGDDTLNGANGNDTLEGGAGNDSLNGGPDLDTASYAGAASAVTVRLALTAAQATAGAGTDTLISIEYLEGSAHNDSLFGNIGNNRLSGARGNDTLDGSTGNDTLDGGLDLDTASYAAASAPVSVSLAVTGAQNTGSAGTDTLIAIEHLTGSNHADRLTGNAANNLLNGGTGNDTLEGGLGTDTLNGGVGVDTASYASATSPVTVRLSLTTAQNTLGAGRDTLLAIENLNGSAFSDTLIGSTANNLLSGGLGNDIFDGGLGDDTLDGGADLDTASYATATAAVTVSLAVAGAQTTGSAGTDTLIAIEHLTGSNHADLLTGNAANNLLNGGGGNDTLEGQDGNDTLQGGAGADMLIGGPGADSLVGGDGADAFKFLTSTDGVDILTAFLPGTDRIEVVSSTFGSLPLGALDPSRLITGAPISADPVFLYDTATGALSFDQDGTGASTAQPFATLMGLPALTASGIVVVAA